MAKEDYYDSYATLMQSTQMLVDAINTQKEFDLQNRIAEHDMELAEKQFALSEENQAFNQQVAVQNFGLQVAQHDYEKRLNDIKMQREDNAIQRRVADYQQAGFSPLSAIGSSGAGVGDILSGTTPQYDPTGVNSSVDRQIQALQNKQGAYARQMQAIQNKRNQRLQAMNYSMQMSNMLTQIANNKVQRQLLKEEVDTQRYKNKYYERFGYNEESPTDRLFSKLINYALDKYDTTKNQDSNGDGVVDTPVQKIENFVHSQRDKSIYNNLGNNYKINTFEEKLKETTQGNMSYIAIRNFVQYCRFEFGFDPNIKSDRFKSLSNDEVRQIIEQFEQYRKHFMDNYKR